MKKPAVAFTVGGEDEAIQEKKPLVVINKKKPGFRKKFVPLKDQKASEFDETPIKPVNGPPLSE